jgi:hypothetical protein
MKNLIVAAAIISLVGSPTLAEKLNPVVDTEVMTLDATSADDDNNLLLWVAGAAIGGLLLGSSDDATPASGTPASGTPASGT